MSKELTIYIAGKSGSGKSRILYLIKEALKERDKNGNLNISDIDFQDFDSEAEFDSYMSKNAEDVYQSIFENTNISLKEVPINSVALKDSGNREES